MLVSAFATFRRAFAGFSYMAEGLAVITPRNFLPFAVFIRLKVLIIQEESSRQCFFLVFFAWKVNFQSFQNTINFLMNLRALIQKIFLPEV